MCFVWASRAKCKDVDIAFGEEKVYPIFNRGFNLAGHTVVEHLDTVVVADDKLVFHAILFCASSFVVT